MLPGKALCEHGGQSPDAMLYTLITVVTPAEPTQPGLFGSRLPGPFAAVCATGSHLPRLSEALATGTRPVRSLCHMWLLCLGVYGRRGRASMVLWGGCAARTPWIKSPKSP